jgi:aspartyl-tRNA(Asn)/glutamyl-tRNA(Gln) amidotransferase subunit C
MTESISIDTFNHLVDLAALELSPEQADYILRELNHQLGAINELEKIPLNASLTGASHGVSFPTEICPALRADVTTAYPDPGAIIALAPETDGGRPGYIVVPDIPHTTLE